MIRKQIFFFILAMFLVVGLCAAQNSPLYLDAGFFGSPDVVTLQDLNLLNPSGTPLFFVDMAYRPTGEGDRIDVTLSLTVSSFIQGETELMAEGKTRVFTLTKAEGIKRITNLTFDSELQLDYFRVVGDKTINKILATGSLPNGEYYFRLILEDASTGPNRVPSVEKTITMRIENPTTIELIYPGQSVTLGGEFSELKVQKPIFIWQADPSKSYTIKFAQLGENDDINEVLSFEQENVSDWKWIVKNHEGVMLQYPNDKFELQPNKKYVWQVSTAFTGPGGTPQIITSEIFGFIYTGGTQTHPLGTNQQILFMISTLLSKAPGEYATTARDIAQKLLNGDYTLVDGYPTYNGQKMTLAGLRVILNLLNSPDKKLEFVRIEH